MESQKLPQVERAPSVELRPLATALKCEQAGTPGKWEHLHPPAPVVRAQSPGQHGGEPWSSLRPASPPCMDRGRAWHSASGGGLGYKGGHGVPLQ